MKTSLRIVPLLSLLLAPLALAAAPEGGKWSKLASDGKDLNATFHTTIGDFSVRLFAKDAPKTVANFVGLATGEKEFTDLTTGKKGKKHFYDGTSFHRVIPDFMVQGGDPLGTGTGGPGYQFEDEFQSGRKFDKVGLLAMANAGPGTNGSQFFVTTSKPEYLNGRHTIFGEVTSGYDVVEKISKVARGPNDKPNTPVVLTKLEISSGAAAPAKAKKAAKEP